MSEIEDGGLYLFLFSFLIFFFLDLELGNSMSLQIVIQCDMVSHIGHISHDAVTSYGHIIIYHIKGYRRF